MDKNKLKVLRETGYIIPGTCGMCEHGQFPIQGAAFGTCALKTYQHEKHTGAPRQLSVFKAGRCDDFKIKPETEKVLGAWGEFLDRREHTRSNRHKAKTRY
jgi:hypothetical protein